MKPLLVLDMDQTLIDYFEARPALKPFLRWAFRHFEVAIWTHASRGWYQSIYTLILGPILRDLSILDFVFVWTMEDTFPIIDHKPLSLVWKTFPDWHAGNTFFVDDRPENFTGNPQQCCFWIPPFSRGNKNDEALLKMKKILEKRKTSG